MTQAGEITPSMMRQWQDDFRKCMDENRHRREPYYIFTTGKWNQDATVFDMKIKPMDFRPPWMLSTMLHKIDNVAGSIEEVWVLPMDAPVDESIPLGAVDEGLIKVAPYLPLNYN